MDVNNIDIKVMADHVNTTELATLRNGSYKYYAGTDNRGYQTDGPNQEVKDPSPDKPMEANDNRLQRTMGYRQGFILMILLIVGGGIFVSPGLVANDTSSAGMMLITWVVAGILAMMGSLCYCELGGVLKIAGGNYMNILKVYGKVPTFLSAWTTCLIIDPSNIAATGLMIGLYFAKPFYASEREAESTSKIIAAAAIFLSLIINSIGSKVLQRAQNILATVQVASLLFLIALGVWQLAKGEVNNFHNMFNSTSRKTVDIKQFGIALFGALWSYDGWAFMNNIIEEMNNMERNLLLTVMTAFPFIIMCYILTNISLMTLLSHSQMSASKAVGVEFVSKALGQKWSYLMMILVGISAYGAVGGTMFAQARLTLAAAREGHMPYFLSFIYKKNSLPIPATILTTTIALLMLIPKVSDLSTLILLFSQAQWIIYGSSILGVVILRVRQPNVERPFKIFIGIPILMSLVAAILVILPFFRFPYLSLALFGFIFAGIPIYIIFIHFHESLPGVFLFFSDKISDALQTHLGLVPCSASDV